MKEVWLNGSKIWPEQSIRPPMTQIEGILYVIIGNVTFRGECYYVSGVNTITLKDVVNTNISILPSTQYFGIRYDYDNHITYITGLTIPLASGQNITESDMDKFSDDYQEIGIIYKQNNSVNLHQALTNCIINRETIRGIMGWESLGEEGFTITFDENINLININNHWFVGDWDKCLYYIGKSAYGLSSEFGISIPRKKMSYIDPTIRVGEINTGQYSTSCYFGDEYQFGKQPNINGNYLSYNALGASSTGFPSSDSMDYYINNKNTMGNGYFAYSTSTNQYNLREDFEIRRVPDRTLWDISNIDDNV